MLHTFSASNAKTIATHLTTVVIYWPRRGVRSQDLWLSTLVPNTRDVEAN